MADGSDDSAGVAYAALAYVLWGIVPLYWRLLHAADYGVPQLRPRFVLVAMRPDDFAYVGWSWKKADEIPSLTDLQYEFAREHSRAFEAVATYKTEEFSVGNETTAQSASGPWPRATPQISLSKFARRL